MLITNKDKKKITVNICNVEYYIYTTDPEEYIVELADKLNADITENMQLTGKNMNTCTIFTALNYLDDYNKSVRSNDNFRTQVKDYSDDACKLRQELIELKKENERLVREITQLRQHKKM